MVYEKLGRKRKSHNYNEVLGRMLEEFTLFKLNMELNRNDDQWENINGQLNLTCPSKNMFKTLK